MAASKKTAAGDDPLSVFGEQSSFVKQANLNVRQKKLVAQKLEHLQNLHELRAKITKVNRELLEAGLVMDSW